MDHYYHHYQFHNQWRQPPPPPPQLPNLCTVCSTPHFPFCPPFPPYHHQNPNYPPQPPYYARPGYDPYQPPLPPTPPPPPPPPTVPNHHHPAYTSDPRSWHQNQNPSYSYDYATAGSGGDVDRSYKRPRIEELPGPGLTFSEDERRLKLIHDHGSATFSGLNQENRYFQNNINKVDASSIPPRSSEMYNIEDSVNNYNNNNNCVNNNYSFNHQHQIQPKDLRPAAVNNWQGYELRIGNYMQQPGGNNFSHQPPLPASPPPPLPAEPPVQQHPSSEFNAYSSSPNSPFSLFPVPVSSSTSAHSTYPVVPQPCYQKKPTLHAVGGFTGEDRQVIHMTHSVPYVGIPPKQLSSNKPKLLDASDLFKMPNRASRPDHIVIILRGLPGSGKSYLAKMLRDLEVENGGEAPRIHSMDDYFMTEVEKDEETDSISVTSVRSKKTMKKKVMEYCYEPEMVEAYRESMLKAFKRTLEDGIFNFVIVDDRNLRVADFAQFWAIGKRSGYEVYVVEATYKDPVGCAARNIHGFTLDDIQQMAGQWEEAPSLYLQLDIKSLFHGDDLKESGIEEVDMEDGDHEEGLSGGQLEQKPEKMKLSDDIDHLPEDSSNNEKRWDAEGDHPSEVKDLSLSKWSNDLDEDKIEGSEAIKGNLNALSGLIQAYGKKGKSVHWSDQGSDTGFSIGAAKKAKMLSLVIGPGAGYNLKSNPLPKEESHSSNSHGSLKKQTSFQERLRAERESFKAVFDRRKKIGGLDLDEE